MADDDIQSLTFGGLPVAPRYAGPFNESFEPNPLTSEALLAHAQQLAGAKRPDRVIPAAVMAPEPQAVPQAPPSSDVTVHPSMVAQQPGAKPHNALAVVGAKSTPAVGAAAPGGSASTPAIPPTAGGRSSLQALATLSMMQQLWPHLQFTPVDYNPFAVMPKVS